MATPTLEALNERLDRLERENRRFKVGALLVLIGIVAVGIMGQARANAVRVVEAEKFVLRDSQGKERAELSTLGDGSPSLHFYGFYAGRRHAIVSLEADQASGTSGLQFNAANGKNRISLAVAVVGSAVVNVADLDGNVRASLGVGRDGSGGVGTLDKQGTAIWRAPAK